MAGPQELAFNVMASIVAERRRGARRLMEEVKKAPLRGKVIARLPKQEGRDKCKESWLGLLSP